MTSFQLEENLQNAISLIISKHPKAQTDLLYFRTLLIDSKQSLLNQMSKLNQKYQQTKQKLNQKPKIHSQTLYSTDFNFYSSTQNPQRIKSPHNTQKTPKHQLQSCQYPSDFMSLILSQAKSIKIMFNSLINPSAQSSNSIQTSKLMNLHSIYRQFYKSFKRKHNQFLQNYSYDQTHIHKNSTAVKNRLLEELKAQTQRRKLLQDKIEALENTMEKSLLHKDKQLQKLNFKLTHLVNTNFNNSNAVLSCPNCHQPVTIPQQYFVQSQKSIQKQTNQNLTTNHSQQLLGPISRQKQTLPSQFNDDDNHHSKNILSPKSITHKSVRSSQFSSQTQSSTSDLDKHQNFLLLTLEQKPNNFNVGRFYDGNDTIMTGTINDYHILNRESQNLRNFCKKDILLKNLEEGSPKKTIHQQRITFGSDTKNHINGQFSDSTDQIEKIGSKKLQSTSNFVKKLQQQLAYLKQQLKEQRYEKIQLEKKIQQSDIDYKKLQNQVNELYKMIDDKKIILPNQQSQNNLHNLHKTSKQSQQNLPIKDEVDDSYVEEQLLYDLAQQKSKQRFLKGKGKSNQMPDFQHCPQNETIENGMTDSSNRISTPKSSDFQTQRLPANHFKTNSVKQEQKDRQNRNIQHQNVVRGLTNNFKELKNQQNQKSLNINFQKTAQFTIDNTTEVETSTLKQFYETTFKQKDQQINNLKIQQEKSKFQTDELMMMLLLQSFTIEEFIKKEKQYQDQTNYRNYFAKDYIQS